MNLISTLTVASLLMAARLGYSQEVTAQDEAVPPLQSLATGEKDVLTNDIVVGDVGESIARLIREAGSKKNFSGVVLAELRGEVVAVVSVGFRDGEAARKNDAATLFELASATKPITAVTCLLLEQERKLSLDDPLNKHLPGIPENCREITLLHLLQNTSGIPGTNYGPYSNEIAEVIPRFLNGGPQKPPGTHFEYWNQGWALSSEVIARTGGSDYLQTTRELCFKQAGMNTACFTGDDPAGRANVAVGTSTTGPKRSALEPPYGDFYGLQYRGMGGVVANVTDVLHFIRAIRGTELLSEASRKRMLTVGQDNYATGWFVENVSDQQRRVYHGGGVRGFLSSVSWYPEDECSLVILSNSDDQVPFFAVEAGVRSILEKAFVQIPESFSAESQQAIAGTYTGTIRNGRNLVIAVSSDGTRLVVDIDWGNNLRSKGLLMKGVEDQIFFVDATQKKIPMSAKVNGGFCKEIRMFDAEFKRQ